MELDGSWHMVPITAADPAASTVTAAIAPQSSAAPTVVRYAWYDNPACPAAYNHFHVAGTSRSRGRPCQSADTSPLSDRVTS